MKLSQMSALVGAPLVLALTVPNIAYADKWQVTLGAGGGYAPKYEGSDKMEFVALPVIDVEWNQLIFLNPGDGLGVHLYRDESFAVDASIGYDMGRDASDSSELRGLGDVDGAATLNLSAEYELGPVTPTIAISKHLGGTDGLLAEFGLETMVPLGDMDEMSGPEPTGFGRPPVPALMFGVATTWADDNYMADYFGVTATQSAASGLRRYTASSGFKSAAVHGGFVYPFLESWAFNVHLEYSQLLGDAADSPIVKNENQFSAASFITYSF